MTATKMSVLSSSVLLFAFAINLSMLLWRSLEAPLSTDEGYNLEVVDNLAQGRGYASFGNHRFDAWWSAKSLFFGRHPQIFESRDWPFDPRVTTGPAVFFPIAGVWHVTKGSVAALRVSCWFFAVLYLAALWFLCPPGPQRLLAFTAAAAVVGSLWFNFVPGTLLGELPGAAYFLVALGFFTKEKWLLGGVFFGLAFLSKHLFYLPIALTTILLLAGAGKKLFSRAALLSLGFFVPVGAFELFRLLSLGSGQAWVASWQEFLSFVREQARPQPLFLRIPEKLYSLSIVGPGWPFLIAVFVAIGMTLLKTRHRGRITLRATQGSPAGFLALSGLATFGFWFFFSEQTGYRQALPATLLGLPGFFLLSRWWEGFPQPSYGRQGYRILAGLCSWIIVGLILLSFGGWSWRAWKFTAWREAGIRAQLKAAEILKNASVKAISPIVPWVEPFPVLTKLRVSPCPGPQQALVVTAWARAATRLSWDSYKDLCATVLSESREFLVCLPRNMPVNGDLTIVNWGAKTTTVGKLPNPQPSGSGAFWFQLAQPQPHKPKTILLINDEPVGFTTWSATGDVLTGPLPAGYVERPATHTVALGELCTGKRHPVGTFIVLDQ
ncbi:MAG: hypothetical protein ACUVRY_09235 [Thermoanaerobaculaceae bacterium]